MTAISYQRGHKIEFDTKENRWSYSDNKSPITTERPCKRCGKMPTKEGHDNCLGHLPNVKAACCGHGVECSYIFEGEQK